MSNDPFAFTSGSEAPKNGAGLPALTPGDYRFRVADIKAGISKNNNPKLVVNIDLLSEEGDVIGKTQEHLSRSEAARWKTDQFAASLGIWPGEGKQYTLYPADVIGLEGTVAIGNEAGEKGGVFNKVLAFVVPEF